MAAGAADRTANAYSRYLDEADVGDLVINPSLSTTAGPDGHVFLNLRRDVSEQVYARSEPALLETALARGGEVTDDVR